MKSDTRANLIFLLVFAVLMAPGAVIVTRKAIRGETRALRAMEPPPVRDRLPYMDPTLAVGAHAAFAPPITADLVRRLGARITNMQPGLTSVVDADPPTPAVMSDGFNVQLLGSGADGGKFRVALLGWNALFHPLPTLYTFTGTRADGSEAAGTLEGYEEQNVPIEVRGELQDAGFIRPPDGTMWMLVAFPGPTPIERVRVHYVFESKSVDDELRLTHDPPATAPSDAR